MVLHHCTKEFLLFSNLNSEEFIHIVKGKIIKFTQDRKSVGEGKKSSQIKFFNKINTVPENSGHGGTEYCDLGKIDEPENSKNSLNFSSLPYRFSELYTLLQSNLYKTTTQQSKSNVVVHGKFLVFSSRVIFAYVF